MSGDITKDCIAIAGVLSPLYLIFTLSIRCHYFLSNNNNKLENMLELKCNLFVYFILSKINLQTQDVLMLTCIANYYLKNTLANTYTHSPVQTNKKCIRLIFIQVHEHNNFPVYN